jgi:hydrophobic/amphiphilic exporter-1 (mainly G- bacteria), HAE1 family
LLVVPSFYDSIEISRDRAIAKFRRRAQGWNLVAAFVVTLLEAFATLLLLRLLWRGARRLVLGRRVLSS